MSEMYTLKAIHDKVNKLLFLMEIYTDTTNHAHKPHPVAVAYATYTHKYYCTLQFYNLNVGWSPPKPGLPAWTNDPGRTDMSPPRIRSLWYTGRVSHHIERGADSRVVLEVR